MRRIVSLVLAIIVMVSSCIPCSDVDAMPAAFSAQASIQPAPANDGCGNHAADFCSPFCTCSCCAGFALPVYQAIALAPVARYTQKVFAAYRSQALAEVFLPIWQPPQIG